MKQIGIAIIGTGWCGGIRAETCAAHPLTKSLHLAEIRTERLAEVAKATRAKSAVADYRELLKNPETSMCSSKSPLRWISPRRTS